MIKKIKYILLLSILFGIGICTPSFARITTNDPTVDSGGTVTITVNSQEPVASGAINVTSAGGLTFKSASGGTVNGTLVAFSQANNKTSGIATYTFTAPTVTETKTYKVSFASQDMADEEGNGVASSSSTATVTVKAPTTQSIPPTNTTKSSDNTLKSITVGDKTFSGSSLKNTITHTVAATVGSIKLSATKNNSKATVSGTGTKSLVEGTNKFNITVTAENGDKKTYKVNVIRLAEESTIPNVIDEQNNNTEEVKLLLTSLTIKDVDLSPEFNSEVYNYTANVQNMQKLEIDATASKYDAQINIEGATDLKEGENIVKITVVLGEESVEYIIKVNNSTQTMVGMTEDDGNNNIFLDYKVRESILIALVCILGIIAIRYIIISYKYSKKMDNAMNLENADEDIENNFEEENNFIENDNIKAGSGRAGRHF